MADIKTKIKGTIKTIDKAVVQTEKFKNNIITAKEKINEYSSEEANQNPESFATTKVQGSINYSTRKGAEKFNKYGKKSVKDTKENIIKGKEKIVQIKSKMKNKHIEKAIEDTTKKTIKTSSKKTLKASKETTKLAKKGIKTTENVVKNTQKATQETIKLSKKAVQISKHIAQVTAKGVKATVQATIKAVKTAIAATKALVSLIIAGGWIAVIIVLIIALIGGFIAAIFNSDGDENFDYSQIPSSDIVLVAKAQEGNEGGDKFWQWYGFTEHVHWCACYVSWCANECGYIEKGIIPKFAACNDGISWFKDKEQWQDRSESYYPIIGDIIFFDWYDDNGNQDGSSDHVGIVTRTDITNKTVYTIEGNSSNKCQPRMYSLDDVQIMGYGTPKY